MSPVVTAYLRVNISWAPWNSGRTNDWGDKFAPRKLSGYLIHPRAQAPNQPSGLVAPDPGSVV